MKWVFAVALSAACVGVFGDPESSSSSAAGALTLQARIGVTSDGIACPPELSSADECRLRTGRSDVPGLGSVAENYVWGSHRPAELPRQRRKAARHNGSPVGRREG